MMEELKDTGLQVNPLFVHSMFFYLTLLEGPPRFDHLAV